MNILIIEDNDLAAHLAKLFIQKTLPSASVDIVKTGIVAKEQVQEQRYDIILIDFGLPDCHGLELAREFRSMGIESMLIAISGNLGHATPEERAEAGLNGGYHKPFKQHDAEEIIQAYETFSSKRGNNDKRDME